MQFTGTELTRSRSIYAQNLNFGWSLDCAVDNTTGRYEFGVSGDAGALAFTLQSGRILAGNTFLHNYAANERFYLECQVTSNTYNLLKDDVPLVMGAGKVSGDYTNLYFHRADPTLWADFNFFASGQNLPNVSIDTQGYLLTTGQNAVTGQFQNLGSYPARVFGSEALFLQGLDFGELAGTVAKQSSGQFAFSGDFSSFNFANPILVDFQTNFENARVAFTITDARSQSSYVYFDPIGSFAFNNSGVLLRNLSYSNYSGGFQVDSFPTEITFKLSYVSGSGIVVGGDSYTTTGYGSFAESGLLTGFASTITGDIVVSAFAWATGAAGSVFTGFGTGYATGEGYSGLATGLFTGLATGIIYNGSGTLLVGMATGYGIGTSATEATESYATGLFDATIVEAIFAYDQNGSSPYLYGWLGSGSPTFTNNFGDRTIYWGSGEDILWALSGIEAFEPGFGVTGYMSGKMLYLASTGVNENGPGEFSNILYIESNVYRGGNMPLTGAWESGSATGYVDINSPVYTDEDDIIIFGYAPDGAYTQLNCIYRPKVKAHPSNSVGGFNNNGVWAGTYMSAEGLASGINACEGIEVSGTAVGDNVILTAKYLGTQGNQIGVYFYTTPPVAIRFNGGGDAYLIGGTVSTPATGFVELLPFAYDPNLQLQEYGAIGFYSDTGNWNVDFYRYDLPGFGNENCYYTNASDLANGLSGSFVGEVFMNGQAVGSDQLQLTAVMLGAAGNTGYYYDNSFAYVDLAGGGSAGSSVSVVPVGVYTGNLINNFVTGSGNYVEVISQSGAFYYKTFTGTWNLFTGLSSETLVTTRHVGTFTETEILVTGLFSPNAQFAFQVVRTSADALPDGAYLQISGAQVLNGISEPLSFP